MNNQWISVNDKLPKDGQRVLVVCTNTQNQMQEHISICDFRVTSTLPEKRVWWSGKKKVTYWMPLPEPPKTT